ncbi:cobalt ECF transporter T component CbiQ [Afifella marina]|uniref:Cobalt/nickel transport system permease protein n=2 Tax=Hyphomicrobiales TaxID=356 RepID=A0A1G5PAJ7_AFIMA|nr:cobalt ECF transporter T component CbiQ [Afifella marina]MBK1624402.1 cobalt ECF transporter T component CbiQ [Afifella marina DSM 2698]MBK1628134.1 cobalt ECF transporter T component CbiQ [Afifella marina]MBK5916568.1 cobalt ECF transporter T component CbiQ [Afifella marina]RAI18933.1 cobalt ECF transporter T component CbiQ [Afifella marina DSM 2698]SCZ46101.1 cobalt/nickel transport system permease protein [Afifella marina DSM 2698]
MSHVLSAGRRALTDTGEARGTLIDGIDVRTRIVVAVAFAIVMVSLQDLAVLTTGLLAAFFLMLSARLPVARTLKRMAMMDSFIIFLIAMLPFTVPGDAMFTVFGFPASWQGLRQAAEIALTANAVILALMALVGSTEPVTLGHALRRLMVPEKLIYLLMFTVRYVDVLQQEYQRLRMAMKARGFRPSNNRHTYRSVGYLVGMMLVRAIERSERILGAMKCRGFTGRMPLFDTLAFTYRDAVFATGVTVFLACLIGAQAIR